MSLIGGSPTIRDKNEIYPQIHIYDLIRLVLQHSEKTSALRPSEGFLTSKNNVQLSLIRDTRLPNKGQLILFCWLKSLVKCYEFINILG